MQLLGVVTLSRAQLYINNVVLNYCLKLPIIQQWVIFFQKSQSNAEEAWDKLRDSDEANRELEIEKLELQEHVTLLEQKKRSLLCALALITGSYFPLLNRSKELKNQRSMLVQQMER